MEACFNCGSESCPGFVACEKKCRLSGKKGCPCIIIGKNLACVFAMDALPAREKLMTGMGTALSERSYKTIKKNFDEYKKKHVNAAASQEDKEDDAAGGKGSAPPTIGFGRGKTRVTMAMRMRWDAEVKPLRR